MLNGIRKTIKSQIMKHYEEVLKILHDQLGWKLYDSLSDKGRELVADTIKAIDIAKNDRDVR